MYVPCAGLGGFCWGSVVEFRLTAWYLTLALLVPPFCSFPRVRFFRGENSNLPWRREGDSCSGLEGPGGPWGSNSFFLLPSLSLLSGAPDAPRVPAIFGRSFLALPPQPCRCTFLSLLSEESSAVPPTAFHFLSQFSEIFSHRLLHIFFASFFF